MNDNNKYKRKKKKENSGKNPKWRELDKRGK